MSQRPMGVRPLPEDRFTLMLVPDAHSQVRRMQIRRRSIYLALCALLVAGALLSLFVVHYSFVLSQVFLAQELSEENRNLRGKIQALNEQVEEVDGHLQEIRRFDQKLRAMTELRDEGRSLAMGPVRQPLARHGEEHYQQNVQSYLPPSGDFALLQLKSALFNSRLAGLEQEAQSQLASLEELVDFFHAKRALLAHTPTTWPAQGWVTSSFGPRDDPFSGERVMHLGTDIAAPKGARVRAPAGGLVLFVGDRGAYGQSIVIDHGRGLVTHYAHLSRILVMAGDRVKRGQHIGAVGNTGRSTGPHLHYEIREHGIPVHPRRFVLQ
jgi:murein DD-endopeptidase MepM/ murein hydrolase activator NlpD